MNINVEYIRRHVVLIQNQLKPRYCQGSLGVVQCLVTLAGEESPKKVHCSEFNGNQTVCNPSCLVWWLLLGSQMPPRCVLGLFKAPIVFGSLRTHVDTRCDCQCKTQDGQRKNYHKPLFISTDFSLLSKHFSSITDIATQSPAVQSELGVLCLYRLHSLQLLAWSRGLVSSLLSNSMPPPCFFHFQSCSLQLPRLTSQSCCSCCQTLQSSFYRCRKLYNVFSVLFFSNVQQYSVDLSTDFNV